MKLTRSQEFSIEIPDKEADAIHSGTYARPRRQSGRKTNMTIVNQAVEYIMSQPDGKSHSRHPQDSVH